MDSEGVEAVVVLGKALWHVLGFVIQCSLLVMLLMAAYKGNDTDIVKYGVLAILARSSR